LENIPLELRRLVRWIGWRWEANPADPKKPKKVPYRVASAMRRASSTDPATWGTFEQALAVVEAGEADGLGFALEAPYVGVDLDDELPSDDHDRIMRILDSYTEVSPSGMGHHVILKARLSGHGRHPTGIGVFQRARFFYCTGQLVEGMPTTIEERQAELEAVLVAYLTTPDAHVAPPAGLIDLDDRDLLERAFAARNGDAFCALWEGRWEGSYPSQSEADFALLTRLAFWTGRDPTRMERLFRSSGLYRPEGPKRRKGIGYLTRTIEKAVGVTTEVYEASSTPPISPPAPRDAASISPSSLSSQPPAGWPEPPDHEAFHGLVGEFVRELDPHTEADSVAILAQTLVAFGNAVGRTPYAVVEGDRHYTNLFLCLVGDTAKARKGTSWGRSRGLVCEADHSWEPRIMSGLSSGEGLIAQVADPEESDESEEGQDTRLLVLESEFVRPLKVANRDGNTLSAVIRTAWDTGTLRTLTRNSPLTASAAHVSIIGHITAEELLRHLAATETANGFANRFLWLCVRRSKSLPEGGSFQTATLESFARRMQGTIEFARRWGEIERDGPAREFWAAIYEELSVGETGLVGALLARSEAQVLRLSVLYALLDRSAVVRVEHLRAAVALWRYAERSVRFLFGDSTGNPDADVILRALRDKGPDGLTRTEIANVFGRHASAIRIERALRLLAKAGLANSQKVPTRGRPEERWWAR
jgi:hypothetical protein